MMQTVDGFFRTREDGPGNSENRIYLVPGRGERLSDALGQLLAGMGHIVHGREIVPPFAKEKFSDQLAVIKEDLQPVFWSPDTALVGRSYGAYLLLHTLAELSPFPGRVLLFSPVLGIDLSHHQGIIDWGAVRTSGVSFAYIKASEGADWRDPHFSENWRAAGQAKIVRGAYHFFTFCATEVRQAENFISAVPFSEAELPPVANVEFVGNCERWEGIDRIREELTAFLRQVESSRGRRPILYVTGESYRRIIRGHFPEYDLWVRNVILEPSPQQFGQWTFWQFADNGRMRGVPTLVDLNVFCGTREEFDLLVRHGETSEK